jgi:hypothetical protein
VSPPNSGDPEKRFAALVEAFAQRPSMKAPDESGSRRFGSSALKVK